MSMSSDSSRRTESATSLVSPETVAALGATLGQAWSPGVGEALPPLWHWIFFWIAAPPSELGPDGHPKKGGFLPDLGLPRRMWAGGRLNFHIPIVIGRVITRQSRILDVQEKTGRTGRLAFVTVKHEFRDEAGTLVLEEEQDIVYRDPPGPGASTPAPSPARTDETWRREVVPNEVLLFRYSALTFNGHRIHYDQPYATQVEGYPGLVVHGPLIATLIFDLVGRSRPGARVTRYAFKAVRPTFLGHGFDVCGKPAEDGSAVDLWSRSHDGLVTMTARAELA